MEEGGKSTCALCISPQGVCHFSVMLDPGFPPSEDDNDEQKDCEEADSNNSNFYEIEDKVFGTDKNIKYNQNDENIESNVQDQGIDYCCSDTDSNGEKVKEILGENDETNKNSNDANDKDVTMIFLNLQNLCLYL